MTGISIETTLELWAASLRAIKARMARGLARKRAQEEAGADGARTMANS